MTLQQIEDAVRKLSPEEHAEFQAWYAEYTAANWDRQIQGDASAGRLDWLVDEARADIEKGRCTER